MEWYKILLLVIAGLAIFFAICAMLDAIFDWEIIEWFIDGLCAFIEFSINVFQWFRYRIFYKNKLFRSEHYAHRNYLALVTGINKYNTSYITVTYVLDSNGKPMMSNATAKFSDLFKIKIKNKKKKYLNNIEKSLDLWDNLCYAKLSQDAKENIDMLKRVKECLK